MQNKSLIGITGGIASGKSVLSSFLKSKGYAIIEADALGHQVLESGQEGYQRVLNAFGDSILNEEQEMDRHKLGRLIFSDPKQRLLLNQLVHPLIKQRIQEEFKYVTETRSQSLVFLDAAVLIEAQWHQLCHKVWLIWANQETCTRRLCTRNALSQMQAQQRIDAQLSHEQRLPYADLIFENNGSIKKLHTQIEKALSLKRVS